MFEVTEEEKKKLSLSKQNAHNLNLKRNITKSNDEDVTGRNFI
jgi:hypothetical protein